MATDLILKSTASRVPTPRRLWPRAHIGVPLLREAGEVSSLTPTSETESFRRTPRLLQFFAASRGPSLVAAVSVKRVVRAGCHIKPSWSSARRVTHLAMAAAWNRHAAHDGASNLWLCSSGSLRVALMVFRRRAGRHQRNCNHNGRNNGYDYFHASILHELGGVPKPLLTALYQNFPLRHTTSQPA